MNGFGGRRVACFESRRAQEMASLVTRHGGVPVVAPALREVTLAENAAALDFAARLRDGAFHLVILMTGVGTRALAEECAPVLDRASFAAALARTPRVCARGPKPAAALRDLGLARDAFEVVSEPNTWREVVALANLGPLVGARVAVQEHGAPSVELYEALRGLGAEVTPVPVYKWALPEDTRPLRAAIEAIASGEVSIAIFTSRAQVEHAMAIASERGVAEAVRRTLSRGVLASIGPVCSDALRAEGMTADLEPTHPKMGQLVKETAEQVDAILHTKLTKAG